MTTRDSEIGAAPLRAPGGGVGALVLAAVVTAGIGWRPAAAEAQEVYRGCGKEGSARSASVRALNRLKNRDAEPKPADVDPRVSLTALLELGDDEDRWDPGRAAEVVGYVTGVKAGGVESCNCGAREALHRDTHIELALDPRHAERNQRVIVEVSPRWRAKAARGGADWTTRGLRKELLGRWVRIRGWLLFDAEHVGESENTRPGRTRNWRATAWEIHPITGIETVPAPR